MGYMKAHNVFFLLTGLSLGMLLLHIITSPGEDAQPAFISYATERHFNSSRLNSSSDSSLDISEHVGEIEHLQPDGKDLRYCTADELLPGLGGDLASRWLPLPSNTTHGREYNCTCLYTKSSYFCPNGRTDYPSWVPKPVAEKECKPVDGDALDKNPFPPGASILAYGNSHLRQVVEGIMCMYTEKVVRREAVVVLDDAYAVNTVAPISLDRQCRGNLHSWAGLLTRHHCITEEGAELGLRCHDDRAVFELDNKATIHYWFAHTEGNKSVEHAFQEFGTSIADYDFVLANTGNPPVMSTERVVSAAQQFHQAGIPFLWLSTYDGEGDIRDWSAEDRQAFEDANAKYVPVSEMMKGMSGFTRGVAEHVSDDHFCLPGPPNQLGLLVLQLLWALHDDL